MSRVTYNTIIFLIFCNISDSAPVIILFRFLINFNRSQDAKNFLSLNETFNHFLTLVSSGDFGGPMFCARTLKSYNVDVVAEHWWNDTNRGQPIYCEKFDTTPLPCRYFTWTSLGSNPGLQ